MLCCDSQIPEWNAILKDRVKEDENLCQLDWKLWSSTALVVSIANLAACSSATLFSEAAFSSFNVYNCILSLYDVSHEHGNWQYWLGRKFCEVQKIQQKNIVLPYLLISEILHVTCKNSRYVCVSLKFHCRLTATVNISDSFLIPTF